MKQHKRALFALLSVFLFAATATAQAPATTTAQQAVVFGQKIQYVDTGGNRPVVVLLHGLVGNSLGGWIAAAYALKYPSKVERLVLVDAAGFAPPKEFDLNTLAGLNPSTRDEMKRLAGLVFYNPLFKSDAAIDAGLAQRMSAGDGYTIQRLVESIHHGDDMLDGKLSGLKQPVLLIWGREDGLTQLAREGERFKREIPGAQLVVFDQCGHVPQVEKAAEFNAALLKFLSQ